MKLEYKVIAIFRELFSRAPLKKKAQNVQALAHVRANTTERVVLVASPISIIDHRLHKASKVAIHVSRRSRTVNAGAPEKSKAGRIGSGLRKRYSPSFSFSAQYMRLCIP
jgi:hypothetical protein